MSAGFTMYSASWCPFCRRLKKALAGAGIGYDHIDIDEHPETMSIVASHNSGNHTVPTLVYPDGSAQTNPSLRQVQAKLASLA